MIPWRLQFTGIRDYGHEKMMLDQAEEHVLITGPNGAGKSTISFCMGAVLRSAKVDIEGLKSQNLAEDETWRAAIHLLFKNEGPSRVDAPLFIEFRLLIEQPPKDLIKLRYEIHDGETFDELELRQAFRSGDVNKNNFTAYKRELEFKYKIHPDLYYLIWYQQEVNQFSVMAPEERFRIFSEMHKIDRIQKDWEVSLEIVKEAQEAFRMATTQQKLLEMDLTLRRDKKDRFENNRMRLLENGKDYAQAVYGLRTLLVNNVKEAEEYIKAREQELEAEQDVLQQDAEELEQVSERLIAVKSDREEQQNFLAAQEDELSVKEEQLGKAEDELAGLRNELSDLQEEYARLPYTETETKAKLAEAERNLERSSQEEQAIKEQLEEVAKAIEKNRNAHATMKAAAVQWENQRVQAMQWIDRYRSSHQLQADLKTLESKTDNVKEDISDAKKELMKLTEEYELLKENRVQSRRQTEAISHLKKQGITAYPLRHFIKLADHLPIEKERLFDAVKYTIFYQAPSCMPLNDLYHVSLEKVVPDRSVINLPAYGLYMREGLTVQEENHASRVLWWLEQFFLKEQPRILKGLLWDSQGVRGPAEQNTFILSNKAVEERRKTLETLISRLSDEVEQLQARLSQDTDTLRVWNADVQKVKEAEAFLSDEASQRYRLEQIDRMSIEYQELTKSKGVLENDRQAHWKTQMREEGAINELEGYLAVFAKFGQQAQRIADLQALEMSVKQQNQEVHAIRRSITSLSKTLDDLFVSLQKYNRSKTEIEDRLTAAKRNMEHIKIQISGKREERLSMHKEAVAYEEELEALRTLIPHVVEEALKESSQGVSMYEWNSRLNKAKIGFEQARNEKDIDPHAVENFRTLESEVLRKKDELESAKNLLDENEQRANQNEQRLETAINMQVTKINLLFQEYMGEFQFEGRIDYEKFTDKKGRPVFKLFIYVRKEGHRGKFEDVSVKARGGRVGKGVSGGEESLSSLLFALALLQNLENQAGFIVLDEFDSALDENRKSTVFRLYAEKLERKLIILSPKAHEDQYYQQFSKVFIVSHDPKEVKSRIRGIQSGQS
ncbi:AAA family ATPase [Sporosarcina cyprini]|uniref:AAA family ATPase n=1 Tax=Sporosarcina cyprini TaxID=2910523 RepID=UPI001EDCA0B7|nr:AAA family ATPase [Sporosarcina cyprini]MCG3088384.1 AAA family ATPase [Sporosarcina cyprini]